jgi:2'-5' RNA ligase
LLQHWLSRAAAQLYRWPPGAVTAVQMSNTVKRAIVILPKFDGLDLIDQLRRRFDPLASKIDAHITLVFPFDSDLSAGQLRAHLQQAIGGMAPFQVRLRGITGHDGEYLFLNVKLGNDQLIDLHDRLYSGPLATYLLSECTYVPHVTVGHLPDRIEFLKALEVASEVSATFQTVVSEVCTYRIESDGNLAEEFGVSLCSREASQ